MNNLNLRWYNEFVKCLGYNSESATFRIKLPNGQERFVLLSDPNLSL